MAEYVPFRKIDRKDVPGVQPLTPEQKTQVGAMMRIHTKDHNKIIRVPVLVLPEVEMCLYYMQWFIMQTGPGKEESYGITIRNKEDWIQEYGKEALPILLKSFRDTGCPTQHWSFMHSLDKD